ncbi:histidine-tRNA ligase [Rhynchospora pubera]|uniref:Histidine-tRNA ligase n=1 Tax=Rhynchospora pubera TaxID=906938 RepID=A0AAV8D0Y1_9POAL|nr:histidine-tRNA ligase [Rhynchospora pubera]
MSGGELPKVTRQDIQLVQNLIERCLQLYMNKKEVIDKLLALAKIEQSFTELVWQKLEEENRDFFNAYYVRLMLKNQIMVFNRLLDDQYRLMSKEHTSALTSAPPVSNGSNPSTLNQNTWDMPCATTGRIPNNMMCNGGSGSSAGALINGTHSQLIHTDRQVQCINPNPGSMNPPQTLSGSTGRFNGVVNGAAPVIKTESSFGDVGFGFNDPGFLEPCPSMGDASGGSFSSSELTGQALADPILDIDSSFGFLSQIPRNFSFSDLTEDFSQSAEILENYGRSPFLPSDANNFSDSTGEGGNKRLDTISEGVTYEDFASD